MNKWLFRLGSFFVAVGLLIGCTSEEIDVAPNDPTTENNVAEETVAVTISKDKGTEVIAEKEISFKTGDLLLDVMKENFEIEEEDGFVIAIDGIKQDAEAGIGWMYFINDETAMIGAAEYELEADDQVNFDLQAWE